MPIDYKARARKSVDGFQRKRAAIHDDKHLSPTGKRNKIAELHQDLTDELASLRTKHESQVTTHRYNLEQRLFGDGVRVAADAISWRDAQDRVDRIVTDNAKQPEKAAAEAGRLMERAVRSGDRLLAKALLAGSFEQQWDQPINTYLEAKPDQQADAQELWDMHAARSNIMDDLMTEMVFTAPALDHAPPMPANPAAPMPAGQAGQ